MNKKIILIWFINILLLGIFVWLYQYVIVVQEKEAMSVRRELAVLEESRRLLRERDERYLSWQEADRQLRDFFFRDDNLVARLEFLEEKARFHNLNFEVSSLDENESPLLQVIVRGDFTDTLAFFRASQSGSYGITIQEGIMRQQLEGDVITKVTFLFYEAS